MAVSISNTAHMLELFQDAAGLKNAAGNPRNKQIVLRILQETARLIEELEISDGEFWAVSNTSTVSAKATKQGC